MPPSPSFTQDSIFLGFDFGTKRIGVASGQKITATATPLKTLKAKNGEPIWEEIDAIVATWRPAALIIGMPIMLDGKEQEITQRAKSFMAKLHHRYKLPAYGFNEQLTTKDAKERVFSALGYKALKKENIDSIAAKLILEGWMMGT